jgi:hypothetical protein
MQPCIKILLFQFIWSSTCFGQHTAHHQEPKTALAASSFSNMEGCWMCNWWTLSGTDTVPDNVHQLHVQQHSMYAKPEAASAVLGSWWWAVCHPKHVEFHINWNNKILIHGCILLDFSLWIVLWCTDWQTSSLLHWVIPASNLYTQCYSNVKLNIDKCFNHKHTDGG